MGYSQAFGRKNEYKDKCKELERTHALYKKESKETIEKCKQDTETERNMKLKLIIDNHEVGKFAEELEQKVDNLIKEYEVLSKKHEEADKIMIKNHEAAIKKERSMISDVTMKVQTLEGEVKRAREFYTRKIKDNDKKVEEKERDRLDQIQLVINKEGIIRELKESLSNKENEIKTLKDS